MKPFRTLTLFAFALLLPAQEGAGGVVFTHVSPPMTGGEIAGLIALVAVVAGGVFFLVRRRKDETPRMTLHD